MGKNDQACSSAADPDAYDADRTVRRAAPAASAPGGSLRYPGTCGSTWMSPSVSRALPSDTPPIPRFLRTLAATRGRSVPARKARAGPTVTL